MENTYTNNLLIKLLYNELDALDRLEMEHIIASDSTVADSYEVLTASKRELPLVHFSPKDDILNVIMDYAA